jgi:hypothetical protein
MYARIKIMNKLFDSFYFLHVPKTAGRFFTHNIVVPLDKILKEHGIENFYDRETYVAHRFWADFITDKTYVTSLFRDPIKHAVSFYSHYAMLDRGAQRTMPVGAMQFNKNTMMDWFENNSHRIGNMQSKNFLLSDLGGKEYGFMNSEKVINCEISKEIMIERLQDVSLLIKSEQLHHQNIQNVFDKILQDLKIPQHQIKHNIQKASNYWNPDSTRIYKSLDNTDRNRILEWNNVDAEVYHTESVFYNINTKVNQ